MKKDVEPKIIKSAIMATLDVMNIHYDSVDVLIERDGTINIEVDKEKEWLKMVWYKRYIISSDGMMDYLVILN